MVVKKSAGKAKKVTRKATRKAAGKTSAVKKVAKKVPVKVSVYREPLTKSAIVRTLSEATDVKKSDVSAILENLGALVEGHVGAKAAAGSFTIPGLLKIVRVYKPAKKARKGINPFTGEETTFKAKPAHYVVKIRALKKLKDIVSKIK